jgi:DNA-binding NarL/FixJ family response regulator
MTNRGCTGLCKWIAVAQECHAGTQMGYSSRADGLLHRGIGRHIFRRQTILDGIFFGVWAPDIGNFALKDLMPQTKSLTKMNGSVQVLVADSTTLTGQLIAEVLRRDRRLAIIDASGSSVLATATPLMPDVAIISETLDGVQGKGFEILKELRAAVPKTRTVMLLDSGDRKLVVEAFQSGARGVFCRNDSLEMLARCVHKVHDGQLWVNGPQLEFLLETLATAPATQLMDSQGATLLSNREQDVVRFLAEGRTNREIASELNLSENTVKNYLFRIFNKLGMSSRVEVVRYATQSKNGGRVVC